MRIAVFGDIHGNLFGLEAALADLRTQSPDAMLVTGDLVYKLPWGAEVIDLLRTLPHQAVIGNAELYLTLWGTPLWPGARWDLPLAREVVEWERARLGPERLAWLAALPEHVALSAGRLEDLLVVHGVPGNPFLPLLPRPGEDRSPWVQTDARAAELLGAVDADVVVAGHTHTVMFRRVPVGRTARYVDRQSRQPELWPRQRRHRRAGHLRAAGLVGGDRLAGDPARGALRSGADARGIARPARRLPGGGLHRQPDATAGRRTGAGAAARFHPLSLGRRARLVGAAR